MNSDSTIAVRNDFIQNLHIFEMSAVLKHVLLLQKDVQKAAHFYQEGLGLPIVVLTARWAELQAGASKIAIKEVEGCVLLSVLRYHEHQESCNAPFAELSNLTWNSCVQQRGLHHLRIHSVPVF